MNQGIKSKVKKRYKHILDNSKNQSIEVKEEKWDINKEYIINTHDSLQLKEEIYLNHEIFHIQNPKKIQLKICNTSIKLIFLIKKHSSEDCLKFKGPISISSKIYDSIKKRSEGSNYYISNKLTATISFAQEELFYLSSLTLSLYQNVSRSEIFSLIENLKGKIINESNLIFIGDEPVGRILNMSLDKENVSISGIPTNLTEFIVNSEYGKLYFMIEVSMDLFNFSIKGEVKYEILFNRLFESIKRLQSSHSQHYISISFHSRVFISKETYEKIKESRNFKKYNDLFQVIHHSQYGFNNELDYFFDIYQRIFEEKVEMIDLKPFKKYMNVCLVDYLTSIRIKNIQKEFVQLLTKKSTDDKQENCLYNQRVFYSHNENKVNIYKNNPTQSFKNLPSQEHSQYLSFITSNKNRGHYSTQSETTLNNSSQSLSLAYKNKNESRNNLPLYCNLNNSSQFKSNSQQKSHSKNDKTGFFNINSKLSMSKRHFSDKENQFLLQLPTEFSYFLSTSNFSNWVESISVLVNEIKSSNSIVSNTLGSSITYYSSGDYFPFYYQRMLNFLISQINEYGISLFMIFFTNKHKFLHLPQNLNGNTMVNMTNHIYDNNLIANNSINKDYKDSKDNKKRSLSSFSIPNPNETYASNNEDLDDFHKNYNKNYPFLHKIDEVKSVKDYYNNSNHEVLNTSNKHSNQLYIYLFDNEEDKEKGRLFTKKLYNDKQNRKLSIDSSTSTNDINQVENYVIYDSFLLNCMKNENFEGKIKRNNENDYLVIDPVYFSRENLLFPYETKENTEILSMSLIKRLFNLKYDCLFRNSDGKENKDNISSSNKSSILEIESNSQNQSHKKTSHKQSLTNMTSNQKDKEKDKSKGIEDLIKQLNEYDSSIFSLNNNQFSLNIPSSAGFSLNLQSEQSSENRNFQSNVSDSFSEYMTNILYIKLKPIYSEVISNKIHDEKNFSPYLVSTIKGKITSLMGNLVNNRLNSNFQILKSNVEGESVGFSSNSIIHVFDSSYMHVISIEDQNCQVQMYLYSNNNDYKYKTKGKIQKKQTFLYDFLVIDYSSCFISTKNIKLISGEKDFVYWSNYDVKFSDSLYNFSLLENISSFSLLILSNSNEETEENTEKIYNSSIIDSNQCHEEGNTLHKQPDSIPLDEFKGSFILKNDIKSMNTTQNLQNINEIKQNEALSVPKSCMKMSKFLDNLSNSLLILTNTSTHNNIHMNMISLSSTGVSKSNSNNMNTITNNTNTNTSRLFNNIKFYSSPNEFNYFHKLTKSTNIININKSKSNINSFSNTQQQHNHHSSSASISISGSSITSSSQFFLNFPDEDDTIIVFSSNSNYTSSLPFFISLFWNKNKYFYIKKIISLFQKQAKISNLFLDFIYDDYLNSSFNRNYSLSISSNLVLFSIVKSSYVYDQMTSSRFSFKFGKIDQNRFMFFDFYLGLYVVFYVSQGKIVVYQKESDLSVSNCSIKNCFLSVIEYFNCVVNVFSIISCIVDCSMM